jgi:cysteine desulfurase
MIYLDYQATTSLAPEAFAAMEPWLKTGFANPHSAHAPGRAAAAAVEFARDQVAALLPPGGRVIFTSGATEAINLAIMGTGLPVSAAATEHAAVLDCVQHLGGNILPIDLRWGGGSCLATEGGASSRLGQVASSSPPPLDLVERSPSPSQVDGEELLAIMLVNNEIGTIQPIADLAAAAHAQNKLFLCDAVQAFGRMPIPDGPDMIAISAHKIHGPKGIGALWVRDGVSLAPQMLGGGQALACFMCRLWRCGEIGGRTDGNGRRTCLRSVGPRFGRVR